jgi:hypothetical protein
MFERYNPTHLYSNAMFETDYPHPKCLIDGKIPEFMDRLTGMPQDQLDAVLGKNAMRCWNLKREDIISDEKMLAAARTAMT